MFKNSHHQKIKKITAGLLITLMFWQGGTVFLAPSKRTLLAADTGGFGDHIPDNTDDFADKDHYTDRNSFADKDNFEDKDNFPDKNNFTDDLDNFPEKTQQTDKIEYLRFAGENRFQTAIEISRNNWEQASAVVLARGDTFPDALAGAVLAGSPLGDGPLLLTGSKSLNSETLEEIIRLKTRLVYILGGTEAISDKVVDSLQNNGIRTIRIFGPNRYATAANISTTAVSESTMAFLASGESFADALSISAYAAAQGIPLLLTSARQVPQATLAALQAPGVTEVTLIGGNQIIRPVVEDTLRNAGYQVRRLSGADRFETNLKVIQSYDYSLSQIVVATGTSFPDALAGSVLAAKNGNPVLLVPKDARTLSQSPASSYLNTIRSKINYFLLVGGGNVINFLTVNFLQTGRLYHKMSLQFWDGYGNKTRYENSLSVVPSITADTIDILVPNFTSELKADGSFGYAFAGAAIPRYLVELGHSKGAAVVPMILGSGKAANEMLLSPAKRNSFIQSAMKLVRETGADGIMVDLEGIAPNTGNGLTALMRDLSALLHAEGKLSMIAAMSRTSATAEPWYIQYQYSELAKYADFIQIMTYDYSYEKSGPGPIAPLEWVEKVIKYAVTQIPREKILLGIPAYGRSWSHNGSKWVISHMSMAEAYKTAATYNAPVKRESSAADPVGIPNFTYCDQKGVRWTTYFDDGPSWRQKLALVDKYKLGGSGTWSMHWLDAESAATLYPLLKQLKESD